MDIIKEIANLLNQLSKSIIQLGVYVYKLDPRINALIVLTLMLVSLYYIVRLSPIWKIVWTFVFAVSFHQIFWLLTQIQRMPIKK